MNTRPKNPANARNLNCCVIGSSGSGKTRFWLTPQLLQAHSSYVVVDPKGGVLNQVGRFLQRKGYTGRIRVFNMSLIHISPAKKKEPAKAAQAGKGKRGQTAKEEPEVKADDDRDEWEMTSAELEARKKAERQAGRPKKAPVKKEAPVEDKAELEAKKQKLEQEIREKYGIPKSDKPVVPFVIPETEQVIRIPHEQLVSFKDHPFHVEKNAKMCIRDRL